MAILCKKKAKTFATDYADYSDCIKNQCNPRNPLLFGSGLSGIGLNELRRLKALPRTSFSSLSDPRKTSSSTQIKNQEAFAASSILLPEYAFVPAA